MFTDTTERQAKCKTNFCVNDDNTKNPAESEL